MISSLLRTAQDFPNVLAYEYSFARRTYGGFVRDVFRCAGYLEKLGISHGSRVLLALPNCPLAMTVLYACNALGAAAVFTHPLSAPEEMAFYIDLTGAKLVFTLKKLLPPLRDVYDKAGCKVISSRLGITYPGVLRGSGRPGTAAEENPDADAAILFSGGTTGLPKGVVISNRAFDTLARGTVIAGANIEPSYKMLAILPMFHVFGLGVCVHTPVYSGMTSVLVPRFDAKHVLKLIAKHRINYITGVPTMFEAMLRGSPHKNPDKSPDIAYDFGALRGVFSGGDKLPHDLKLRFDEFLIQNGSPVRIREGYGLTESCGACALTPIDGAPEGSVGLPYDGVEIMIADGEICVSGGLIMSRYESDDEETRHVLMERDGKIWLHTGDLGMIDENGFLYFRGRIKRIIVSSGFNVYPYHVETVIGGCAFVSECCVVGVADDYRMQRVRACTVLKSGISQDAAEKQLRDRCRQALAPQLRPREYVFMETLPKTKLGKVDYLSLSEVISEL